MRKLIRSFAVFLAISLLSLVSCGKELTSETVQINNDVSIDANRDTIHRYTNFCVNEDVVYFISPGTQSHCSLLIYYDEALGVSGPLCGKPQCAHEDEDCNAYMGLGYVYGLTNYDGHLLFAYEKMKSDYSSAGVYIATMDYDGTNRKDIRQVADPTEFIFSFTGLQFFHRDYLFIATTNTYVENGITQQILSVRAYSLSDPKKDFVLLEEKSGENIILDSFAEPYGSHIFFYRSCVNKTGKAAKSQVDMYDWQVGDKAAKMVMKFEVEGALSEFAVQEDSYIFATAYQNSSIIKVKNGKVSVLKNCMEDNKDFILPSFSKDYIIQFTNVEDEESGKRIKYMQNMYDYTGELLSSFSGKNEALADHGWMYCGNSKDFAYQLCINSFTQSPSLVSVSLQNGERKVVWQIE